MASASVQLKVLGSPSVIRTAVMVAQCGKRILLRGSDALATGTLIQATSAEQVILGEVVDSRVSDAGVELSIEAYHSFNQSWAPHPAWRNSSEPASVLDSLRALNRRLQALAPVAPSREQSSARPLRPRTRRTA